MRIVLFMLLLVLTSCATTLKPDAAKIQIVQNISANCINIGEVKADDPWLPDFENVKNKLKNQAAARGGNTLVIDHVQLNQQQTTLATAWRCP